MLINKIISVFFSKKRKSQYKLAFFIFEFLSKIYSRSMGLLEDIFFKNKKYQESFNKTGVFKFELPFNANSLIRNAKKVRMDEFLSIYYLREKEVKKLINKVFDKNTQSLIFKKTSYVYARVFRRSKRL